VVRAATLAEARRLVMEEALATELRACPVDCDCRGVEGD
jgi:hypothetical protein